jgi:hypothetical protein
MGAWKKAKLSEEKNLCDIKIAWYKGHYRVYNSTISVSIDKENYNEVYYGQSSGTTLELGTYLFKEALAGKYLK